MLKYQYKPSESRTLLPSSLVEISRSWVKCLQWTQMEGARGYLKSGAKQRRDWHIISPGDHPLSHSRDSSDGEKDLSQPVWAVILPVSHECPPGSPPLRSSFWALQLASEPKRGPGGEGGDRAASWMERGVAEQPQKAGRGGGNCPHRWLAGWKLTHSQIKKN